MAIIVYRYETCNSYEKSVIAVKHLIAMLNK